MIARNLFSITSIALTTAATTLLIICPVLLDAEEETGSITPIIANPTLNVDGSQITLFADKESYELGDKPQLTLTAINPTDKRIAPKLRVEIAATSPMSRMSRVVAMPESLWIKESQIVLQPGETREIVLSPEISLPEGKTLTISMATDDEEMLVQQVTSRLLSGSGLDGMTK